MSVTREEVTKVNSCASPWGNLNQKLWGWGPGSFNKWFWRPPRSEDDCAPKNWESGYGQHISKSFELTPATSCPYWGGPLLSYGVAEGGVGWPGPHMLLSLCPSALPSASLGPPTPSDAPRVFGLYFILHDKGILLSGSLLIKANQSHQSGLLNKRQPSFWGILPSGLDICFLGFFFPPLLAYITHLSTLGQKLFRFSFLIVGSLTIVVVEEPCCWDYKFMLQW